MTLTTHDLNLEALDALKGVDTLCLFVAEDERPLQGLSGYIDWRLCGGLSRVLQAKFFTGAADDQLLFPVAGRLPMTRLFAVGLGRSRNDLDAQGLAQALATAAKMLSRAKISGVAIEVPGIANLTDEARAAAFTGAFLPAFEGERVAVLGEKGLRQSLSGAAKG